MNQSKRIIWAFILAGIVSLESGCTSQSVRSLKDTQEGRLDDSFIAPEQDYGLRVGGDFVQLPIGTHFTDVLPNGDVKSLKKITDTQYFVGTYNGLVVTGSDFSQFRTVRTRDGLISNIVTDVLVLGEGRVAIATERGVQILDENADPVKDTPPNALGINPKCLVMDPNGVFYVCAGSGLYRSEDLGRSFERVDGVSSAQDVAFLGEKMIISKGDSVLLWDGESYSTIEPSDYGARFRKITIVPTEGQPEIWIANGTEYFVYNSVTFERIRVLTDSHGLPYKVMNGLLVNEGRLYLLSRGMLHVSDDRRRFKKFSQELHGVNDIIFESNRMIVASAFGLHISTADSRVWRDIGSVVMPRKNIDKIVRSGSKIIVLADRNRLYETEYGSKSSFQNFRVIPLTPPEMPENDPIAQMLREQAIVDFAVNGDVILVVYPSFLWLIHETQGYRRIENPRRLFRIEFLGDQMIAAGANGYWKSSDYGKTLTQIGSEISLRPQNTSTFDIADGKILLGSLRDVAISEDGGESFSQYPYPGVIGLVFGAIGKSLYYVADRKELFSIKPDGESRPIFSFESEAYIVKVAVEDSVVALGTTSGVWVSTDRGESFTQYTIDNGLPHNSVSSLHIVPVSATTYMLIVGTQFHPAFKLIQLPN